MVEAAELDGEEVARLRALVAEQAKALKAAQAEAAAAKGGLVAKSLEFEKLKVQIASLRRVQFGRSSERFAHEINQLELRLEELEMAEALNAAASGEPWVCRRLQLLRRWHQAAHEQRRGVQRSS